MNKIDTHKHPDDFVETPLQKPLIGQILASERIKNKLSQYQIAEQLNLSQFIINALENDDSLKEIPSTYVRGYQRSYIRLLKLNEIELLGDLVGSPIKPASSQTTHHLNRPLLVVGILFLITLVIFFGYRLGFLTENNKHLLQSGQAALQPAQQGSNVLENEIQPTANSDSTEIEIKPLQSFDGDSASWQESIELHEPVQPEVSRVHPDSTEYKILSVIDKKSNLENTNEQTNEIQQLMDTNEVEEEVNLNSEQESLDVVLTNATDITFVSNGETWLSISDAEKNRLYRNNLKLDRITVSGVLPMKVSAGNLPTLRIILGDGEQQKVNIFKETTTVAHFLVNKDAQGRLVFLPL